MCDEETNNFTLVYYLEEFEGLTLLSGTVV